MRLTKGSKVEVLSRKEVATGAWRCAEIISGNGHTYVVKYDPFRVTTTTNEVVEERVPRKALRPRAPIVVGVNDDSWVAGDCLEVYHNQSWKKSILVKLLGRHIFSVRLLGSSEEFKVHRFYLRVPQRWYNGHWFVVGRSSSDCSMVEKIIEEEDQKPQIMSTGALKRRLPLDLPPLEYCTVPAKKMMRVSPKDGSHQQICIAAL